MRKNIFLFIVPLILLSVACKKTENTGIGPTYYFFKITSPADSLLAYDTIQVKWSMNVPPKLIRFEYYIDFSLSEAFDTVPEKLFFYPRDYTSGTRHQIQLKAYIKDGREYSSNIVTVQISNLIKPQIFAFTGISKSSLSFSWSDAGQFESGYRVERKINNSSFSVLTTLPPNTGQYTDTGLDSLNSYGYRIMAFNKDEDVLSDEMKTGYNTSNFLQTRLFQLPPIVSGWIAVDPTASRCVATRYNETPVPMIDMNTGNITYLAGHTNGSGGVDFNSDGTLVATGGYDDITMKVWKTSDGGLYNEFSLPGSGIFVVRFNDNGQYLAAGGAIEATVYNIWDGTKTRTFNTSGFTRGMAFTKDSKRLLTGGNADVMELWSMESGALIRTYAGHTGHIGKVVFSNDESRIYSASYQDNTIKQWQTETGQMSEFYAGTAGFSGLICLRDDKIASCEYTGKVLVFENTGQLIQVVNLPNKILDMDYCQNQDMLVCYDNNGGIRCLQRTGHWEQLYQ